MSLFFFQLLHSSASPRHWGWQSPNLLGMDLLFFRCHAACGHFLRGPHGISGRVGAAEKHQFYSLRPTEGLSILSMQRKALSPISALKGDILVSTLPQKGLIFHEVQKHFTLRWTDNCLLWYSSLLLSVVHAVSPWTTSIALSVLWPPDFIQIFQAFSCNSPHTRFLVRLISIA